MKDWDQDRHWTEYIITLKWGSVSIRTYSERSQRSTQEPKRDPSGPEGTARTSQATDSRTYAAKRYTVTSNIVLRIMLRDINVVLRDTSCATWHMNCNICTVQYDIRQAYGGHKILCGDNQCKRPTVRSQTPALRWEHRKRQRSNLSATRPLRVPCL